MRILLGLIDVLARQWDVLVAVEVPELGRDGVGIMRVGHRHGQAERLIAVAAHVVIQILLGLEHHLFIEVQLVGAHAWSGLQHRRHVVVPTGAHVRLIPVHRPAVVGGVDVAGQALFIAMQLVRAAEMHLARQRGAIAQAAQVMGVGRYIGGEVGSVVVSADLRGQLAADQGKARRRAQRAVAVGGVEHHGLGGQAHQVGHLNR